MKINFNFKELTLKEGTDFWIIVFNSVLYYLLALFTVLVSSNLFSLLLGHYNNFQGRLFYYGYIIKPIDGYWSDDDIALIFMFGTMIALLSAIFFERVYKRIRKYKYHIKLYFLWSYILSIVWFVGNIIVGSYSSFSVGSVMSSLHLPMAVRIMISIVFMFLLLFLGRISRKHVLISSSMYFRHLHSDKNVWLVKAQLLFPAFLGIVTYFIYRIPHQADYQFRDLLVHMTVFIFILGVFWGTSQPTSLGFKRRRDWVDFDYWAMGILVVVAVALRIYLRSGYLVS
jgi:hypothetical protein